MKYFDNFTKIALKCGGLGKIIVAKRFEKLPKLQTIVQSGLTVLHPPPLWRKIDAPSNFFK